MCVWVRERDLEGEDRQKERKDGQRDGQTREQRGPCKASEAFPAIVSSLGASWTLAPLLLSVLVLQLLCVLWMQQPHSGSRAETVTRKAKVHSTLDMEFQRQDDQSFVVYSHFTHTTQSDRAPTTNNCFAPVTSSRQKVKCLT